MSSFQCEKCGADITEGPDGRYVTACDHWPLESASAYQSNRELSRIINGRNPMTTYTHQYQCEACDHQWSDQWTSENTSDVCPECDNGPIAPYEYALDEDDQ